jgi:hypothetical protein
MDNQMTPMTNHFVDATNMVDDEWRPRPKYACADQMCGAEDCTTCHPSQIIRLQDDSELE